MRKGMTLIEVLAATALMSALLVPLLMMMQFSSKTTYRSSNDIMATSLAMSKMEELKSLPYFKLENILLRLNPDDERRLNPQFNTITGPFETWPERPDIVETNVFKSGDTMFHRYTYLSYFPQGNPSPNDKDFDLLRKRIKVRVHIFWKDRLSRTVAVDQDLAFETIIHDENYNPKPMYNKFFKDGGS